MFSDGCIYPEDNVYGFMQQWILMLRQFTFLSNTATVI